MSIFFDQKSQNGLPMGPPNGHQNRQIPSKCRPRDHSPSRYQKQHPKSQFLEPPWEGGTWLKCVSVVKYHTFHIWPQGRQIVSKMIPKSSLLGATLAPKLTKMPSKRGTKKTSKNGLPPSPQNGPKVTPKWGEGFESGVPFSGPYRTKLQK